MVVQLLPDHLTKADTKTKITAEALTNEIANGQEIKALVSALVP